MERQSASTDYVIATPLQAKHIRLPYKFVDPQPYPHQIKGLNRVYQLGGRALLACPMRSGKSRIAIDWAGIAARNWGLRRVLVVAPLSVMGVWKEQIEEFCPVPSMVRLLEGSTQQRLDGLAAVLYTKDRLEYDGIEWIIVNYEGIWRTSAKTGGRHVARGFGSLLDALEKWQPDLVIADEAHRIKGATTRQSKAVSRIGKLARYRLALTGTPITKSPLDAFGELRFLDDHIFMNGDKPASWTHFRNEFGVWGGASGYELKGYRNLPTLLNTIQAHSYAIRLEDCFDLPPKTFTDIAVPMPKTTRAVYRQMAKEMIAELQDGTVTKADIVLTKLLRLSQITSGFATDPGGILHDLDSAKIDTALDMIADFTAAGEKVVVFCRFKHDYHRLEQALSRSALSGASGRGFLSLTGETPAHQRNDVIRQFHTDPRAMVFIAQTAAGSLGIDLTPARFVIFLSLSYNWAEYAQAQDRVYGPKQTRPVSIHHLITKGTIDAVVLNSLTHKGRVAEAVMHNPQLLLGGDED